MHYRKSAFTFSIKEFCPSKQIITEILKIGIPTLTFQLLTSLSIAFINREANIYGDAVIAGMGAVTRITSMGTLVVFGFLKVSNQLPALAMVPKSLIGSGKQLKLLSYGQQYFV